jgi:hypothetical protein
MVPLFSLWLPILVSAVVVFFASFVLHMVLPFHRKDFAKLPNEDAAREALGKLNIPPGDYMLPSSQDPKCMKDPVFVEKLTKGPVVLMTFLQPGPPSMGKNLVQWFIFCIVVSILAAYIAGHALKPGDSYLAAFRFAGCTAFIGYAIAQWQDSIWYRRAWSTTIKNNIDGLIYGLLTAGVFGWLWPSV